jgi:putative transposase
MGPKRCWVHKAANLLNKLPESVQPKATQALHAIWMAETRVTVHRAFAQLGDTFGVKYPAAVACLEKDRDALPTSYDFAAEHWRHLRTSNPIESTFSSVGLRTAKPWGADAQDARVHGPMRYAVGR